MGNSPTTSVPATSSPTQSDLADQFGDATFEELLRQTENPPATTPQGTQGAPSGQTPPAQPAATPEVFLETPTGTRYMSREDAAKGVAHKDQVIAVLRQNFKDKLGYDPLTEAPAAPQRREADQAPNYAVDPSRYWQDLGFAVRENNPAAYAAVQQKFILDSLAPLAPAIRNVTRSSALETLSGEIHDIRQFYGSEDYKKTLERLPRLKQAIEVAETNPQFAEGLDEFYRIAYFASGGIKHPAAVAAAATQAAQQQSPLPRPTLTAQTQALPATQSAASPTLATKEGRKAVEEAAEKSGLLDLPF